jgi:hypothetical protein
MAPDVVTAALLGLRYTDVPEIIVRASSEHGTAGV